MSSAKKLKDPRTCRVFVSSPFGGFEQEREELTLKHFPQLSHMCQAKGIQFVTVDMRWGITEEAATDAQVVNICLREVDRSDIFVGLYGQRYGWHGNNDEMLQKNVSNAASRYSWLPRFKDRSVTEMEFLHGHLNKVGAIPAIIGFRSKKYDDGKAAAAKKAKNEREAVKFIPESDEAKKKLDDLKARVVATKGKCLAFKMDYATPQEGAAFIYEEILKHVEKIITGNKDTFNKRDMDLSIHDAFMASRTVVYVGGDNYMKELDAAVAKGGQKIMLTGPAGSGKAACLAHWISASKKGKHSGKKCVYHFIGCASESADISSIMRRLTLELNYVMGDIQKSKQESLETSEDMKASSTELSEVFRELELTLGKAAVKHKIILAIDGLGKVDKVSWTTKTLFWLPVQIPNNVTLIVTCRDGDADVLAELKSRKFSEINIKPLSTVCREEMCKQLLRLHSKELSPDQLEKVVKAKPTENPLYLEIVISELTAFGRFRELGDKIDELMSCKSVNELFQVFLRRLEADYIEVEKRGNLIEQVMSSIWVSNKGLSEKEIMAMHKIPSHEWSPLFFAMQGYIVEMNGLIRFAFLDLTNAVEDRYLKDKNTKLKYQRIVTNYFEVQRKEASDVIRLDDPSIIRPTDELPRIYFKMGDKEKLKTVLCDLSIFSRLFIEQEYELIALWRSTGLSGDEIATIYLKTMEDKYNEIKKKSQDSKASKAKDLETLILFTFMSYLSALSFFFELALFKSAQEKVLAYQLLILDKLGDKMAEVTKERTACNIKIKLAYLYTDTCRYAESEKLHKEVLEIRQKQMSKVKTKAEKDFLLKGIGTSYHGVAMLYSKLEDEEKAAEYYTKAMEVQKQLNNEADVADSLHNLGVMYMKKGDYKQALIMCTKSLKIYEALYFANLPPVIGAMIGNIAVCHRNLGQEAEAEKMYKKAIEIYERALGRSHPNVALGLTNLAILEINRKNHTKAEDYLKESIDIYKKTEDSATNKDYYRSLEKYVYVLFLNKKGKEGAQLFNDLYSMAKSLSLMKTCWPYVFVSMVNLLIESKSYPYALQILEDLRQCKEFPDEAVIQYQDVCKAMGKAPKMDVSLESSFEKNPGNLNLLHKYVNEELIPAGNMAKILASLEASNKARSIGPDLFGTAVMWCQEKGTDEMATVVLEYCVEKFPQEANFVASLVNKRYDAGKYDSILDLSERLCQLEPTNINHWMVTGDVAIRLEKLDLAKKTFQEMSTRFASNKQVSDQAKQALAMISAKEKSLKK